MYRQKGFNALKLFNRLTEGAKLLTAELLSTFFVQMASKTGQQMLTKDRMYGLLRRLNISPFEHGATIGQFCLLIKPVDCAEVVKRSEQSMQMGCTIYLDTEQEKIR